MYKIYYILILISLFVSCVESPEINQNNIDSNADIFVLNEGLWGQFNSTLSKINTIDSVVTNNYFNHINNIKIGDSASEIIIQDSSIFILVSGSSRIIECDYDFKIKNISEINNTRFLRKFIFLEKNILAITDLDDNKLIIFDLLENQKKYVLNTGPSPEDIVLFNDYLFVANSAKGQIYDKVDGARTISVFDIKQMLEIKKIPSGPNVINLEIVNNKLYAAYPNFRWNTDSIGGIIQYNLNDFSIENEWKINIHSDFISKQNKIYFLNETGLNYLDLQSNNIELSISNNSNDIWYDFEIFGNITYICNAKNHTTNGELMIFENEKIKEKYNVGLNPTKVIIRDLLP